MNFKIGDITLSEEASKELYHQMSEYFESGDDNKLLKKYLDKTGEEGFNDIVAQSLLDNEAYEILEIKKDDAPTRYILKKRSDAMSSTETGPVFSLDKI